MTGFRWTIGSILFGVVGVFALSLALEGPTGGLPGDAVSDVELATVRGEWPNWLTCLPATPAVPCSGASPACAPINPQGVCTGQGSACGSCIGPNNRSCLTGGEAVHCTVAPLAACCTTTTSCRLNIGTAQIPPFCACDNVVVVIKNWTTRTNC